MHQVSIKTENWSLKTKDMFKKCNNNGLLVDLCWIPGHSGIHRNDQIDILANQGSTGPLQRPIKGPYCLFPSLLKENFILKCHSWKAPKEKHMLNRSDLLLIYHDITTLKNDPEK